MVRLSVAQPDRSRYQVAQRLSGYPALLLAGDVDHDVPAISGELERIPRDRMAVIEELLQERT